MKIRWDENGFSANINGESPQVAQAGATGLGLLQENGVLVLGAIAFVGSMINLLFGLFLNFSTDALAFFAENKAAHWMVVFLIFSIVLFMLSILSGIFSTILYVKSKKKMLDMVGLILAILAFVVGLSSLILNIIALIAW